MAQRFSATFSPGRDPGDPESSPASGSLHGACFTLCLCLCLSLCVSHEYINKILKKKNQKLRKGIGVILVLKVHLICSINSLQSVRQEGCEDD